MKGEQLFKVPANNQRKFCGIFGSKKTLLPIYAGKIPHVVLKKVLRTKNIAARLTVIIRGDFSYDTKKTE